MEKPSKLTIVGTGNLGNAIAYQMLGRIPEIHLLNRDQKKSLGTFYDLEDAAAATGTRVYAHAEFNELPREGISFICIKDRYDYRDYPNTNDLRLVGARNDTPLIRRVARSYSEMGFKGIIINASNPSDVMTRIFADNFDSTNGSRIYGFGSNLDVLRAKAIIAKAAGNIDPRLVDILVIGEHGASLVPVYSQAKIGRDPIERYSLDLDSITTELKRRGVEIVSRLGHSKFGPAIAVSDMIDFLTTDFSKDLMPMSTRYRDGVFIGLPNKQSHGVIEIEDIIPTLSPHELSLLEESIAKLQGMYKFAKQFDQDQKVRYVLIVDDEPDAAEALKETLEFLASEDTRFNREYQLRIDTCMSTDEAVKKFDGKLYDVLIADQRMPNNTGGTGTDLIQRLKGRKLKAIVHSGKSTEEDLETMVGITNIPVVFIKKPFSEDEKNWEIFRDLVSKL
jgi:L-lactate dehydrogenase